MENKKTAPFCWAASWFRESFLLGASGFYEPPVVDLVRGYNSQDDGNQRYKGDVECHESGR